LKIWVKRVDKLSQGEEDELKRVAEEVYATIEKHGFYERIIP